MALDLNISLPSVLKLRIISAFIGIFLSLVCLRAGPPVLDIFIVCSLIYSLYEWVVLTHQTSTEKKIIFFLLFILLLGYYTNIPYVVLAFLLGFVLLLSYEFFSKRFIKNSLLLGLGFYYIVTAFITLLHLSYLGKTDLILFLLLIVWTADTGAYFSGRWIGGPKLAPTISPSKTWSGFMGGSALALITCYSASPFLNCEASFPSYFFLIMASHCGDLLESALKRFYNTKDSGTLIPGHGGILDRLDSLFLVTIVSALIYL